jgi:hypothetical protein
MGGAAGVAIPDHVDIKRFEVLAGDRYNKAIFDERK